MMLPDEQSKGSTKVARNEMDGSQQWVGFA